MFINIRKIILFLILLLCFLLFSCNKYNNNNLTDLPDEDFIIEQAYLSCGALAVSNGKSGDEERFGHINTKGESVVPLKYKTSYFFSEDLAPVYSLENGVQRCCYIDQTGTEIITNVNSRNITVGGIFIDGYSIVSVEGIEGNYVIDKSGNVCLAPTDEKYYYKNLGGGFFERYSTSNLSNPQGVVNSNGTLKYSGNNMLIMPSNSYNGFYTSDYNEYGIFDNKNYKEISEPVFASITQFIGGVAIVVDKNSTVKIIEPNGECLVDLSKQYKNIDTTKLHEFSNGVTSLNFDNGIDSIIIDINGNTVTKTDYDEIDLFYNNVAICKKDGKYGYVDSKGTEILKPIYEFVTNFDNGVGFVKKNGKQYRFAQ